MRGTITNNDLSAEEAMRIALDYAAGFGSSGNEKGVIMVAEETSTGVDYAFSVAEGDPKSASVAGWQKAGLALGYLYSSAWEATRGHTHPNDIGVSVEDADYSITHKNATRRRNEAIGRDPSKHFMRKKNGELYRVRDDIEVPLWDRIWRKVHFDSSDHQILIEN